MEGMGRDGERDGCGDAEAFNDTPCLNGLVRVI
jgi:hypothetical protein